jgi:phage tail sheath protein FI
MAAQYKTPGVYIVEVNGFSTSVVQVPTAIPAFIGYTEYAQDGNKSLVNVPTLITSMAEFQNYFASPAANSITGAVTGGAPVEQFAYVSKSSTTPPYVTDATGPAFYLYYTLMMFFNNGGTNCYIVSLGTYADYITKNSSTPNPQLYSDAFTALEQFTEPTIVVMPDAMQFTNVSDWTTVSQYALTHCLTMQTMVAILDVLNGWLPPTGSTNPISGSDGTGGFYSLAGLGDAYNRYGMAYYPWVNTNIVSVADISFIWISNTTLPTLKQDLLDEAPTIFPPNPTTPSTPNPKLAPYQAIINGLAKPTPGDSASVIAAQSNSQTLFALSPIYQTTMADIALSLNLLPPSGGMAGVYARNDATFGVYQSPANTTIFNAISPAVKITDAQQADLNVPLNGMAINAIRTFPNYGLLVWGARTLAGNSDDWRYINVRRTMIMLEQSIKNAMQTFMFASNNSLTWVNVNTTISNFLNSQWKAGALAGSKPADAYSVAVGLGATMTGEDILQGMMKVSVGVAVVRPAEFIILTFQQQMQTS